MLCAAYRLGAEEMLGELQTDGAEESAIAGSRETDGVELTLGQSETDGAEVLDVLDGLGTVDGAAVCQSETDGAGLTLCAADRGCARETKCEDERATRRAE